MFTRILVPLDGSIRAEQALPVAARIARASGGSIVLLQVVGLPTDYSGLAPAPIITEESLEIERIETSAYLTQVARLPLLAGIPTTTEVLYGLAAQHILTFADQKAVDLIVLCSHGRTGFLRWMMGSVAQHIVHHSSVPVLVLRDGIGVPEATSLPPSDRLCAVVSLDGSEFAEAALLPAAHLIAAMAAPAQGVLHLTFVVKRTFPSRSDFVQAREVEQVQQYLASVQRRLEETLSSLPLIITWSLAYGPNVPETILKTAEYEKGLSEGNRCVLLAMTTHGRGGLERLMMGSVTESVLQATHLPLLVARPLHSHAAAEQKRDNKSTNVYG